MISNTSPDRSRLSIAATQSPVMTLALSFNFVNSRFRLMQSTAFRFCSTRTACFAPRLNASIAIAPLPLNRSRNVQSGNSLDMILNKVSLIRSVVGLVSIVSIVSSRRLLAVPAITLINLDLPYRLLKSFFIVYISSFLSIGTLNFFLNIPSAVRQIIICKAAFLCTGGIK